MKVTDKNGLTWQLVREDSEELVPIGTALTTFRGEPCVLAGGEPPRHPGSTGRIYVREAGRTYEGSYYPGVCNLRWLAVEAQHGPSA